MCHDPRVDLTATARPAPGAGDGDPGVAAPAADGPLDGRAHEDPAQEDPARGARARRAVRVVRRALLVLLVLLVLALAWVGFRAWQAATALQDARDGLAGVELDASALATSGDDLAALRDATARAAAAAEDPVWRLAEHVPWAGDQLVAVRVVATSLDAVAADVLPAAADLRALLDGGLRGADGRFDVAALRVAAARVETAGASVGDADARLAALDPDALVAPLSGPVRDVQDAVARLDARLAPAARLAGVLPAMLGGDGPRTYLVLALNSGELRAAGGIVGTVVAVRVDDGAVSIVDTRSTADLRPLPEPVLPATDAERALWGDRLGRWVQNAVMTPDFPRSAELVAARWSRDVGVAVDGVVATDPVAVASLVGATGPVVDPDGRTVDGASLVGALLRDAYVLHPDPVAADAYFGAVAASVVASVGSGAGDGRALVAAARDAVDERRLRVWSAHPAEQERLAATVAGGAFTSSDLFADQPGLFLDDATQGKLGAYLDASVTFRDARCDAPTPTVTAVLRLDLRAPQDVASFPRPVTGYPGDDVPLGTLLTSVSAWSARDGAPLVVRRDGAPATGDLVRADGRSVQQVASRLTPGQVQEVTVDLPLHAGGATLWTTPTVSSPGVATFRCP